MTSRRKTVSVFRLRLNLLFICVLMYGSAVQADGGGAKSKFNLWEGDWASKGLLLRVSGGGTQFSIFRLPESPSTLIASGEVAPTKDSGRDKYALAGNYSVTGSDATLVADGIMVAQFLNQNDLERISVQFFEEGSSTALLQFNGQFDKFSGLHETKLKLQIKGDKPESGQFKAGDTVKLSVSVKNKGTGVLPAGYLLLTVPLTPEIADDLRVTRTKHMRRCNAVGSDLLCTALDLGPQNTTAAVTFRFRVPEELSGSRLAIKPEAARDPEAFDVETPVELKPDANQFFLRVEKGKGTDCASKVVGTWQTNVGSTFVFFAGGTYEGTYNNLTTPGIWTCAKKAGAIRLNLGTEADPKPIFYEHYTLTNATHFEGTSSFGTAITADKIS